jgi:hypothetical protein
MALNPRANFHSSKAALLRFAHQQECHISMADYNHDSPEDEYDTTAKPIIILHHQAICNEV